LVAVFCSTLLLSILSHPLELDRPTA